ncbi:hypothetical protein VB773_10515 [Haloarculaceae archaeon H-GB2-1]|nr:hypothetical protein [Haloarculaceae archaeon H-GB1-1]MEA5386436.1 hypothetical protein [Haloarculaceae archaeon H-GB11]MEA5407949.1 hypothetical protein [Haloarculaceae archaeon H-GB2-1]
MYHCRQPGCGWQAIAPSESAAREQYLAHLLDEHTTDVDADVPEGMVQVKLDAEADWVTVTVAEAKRLHERNHD